MQEEKVSAFVVDGPAWGRFAPKAKIFSWQILLKKSASAISSVVSIQDDVTTLAH
jgi:hypothetical protein